MLIKEEDLSDFLDSGNSDAHPMINHLTECNLIGMKITGKALIRLLSQQSLRCISEDEIDALTESITETFSSMNKSEQQYLMLAINVAYTWQDDHWPYITVAKEKPCSSDFIELCHAIVERGAGESSEYKSEH